LIKHVIENLPARLRHNISGSKITVGLLSVSFKRAEQVTDKYQFFDFTVVFSDRNPSFLNKKMSTFVVPGF